MKKAKTKSKPKNGNTSANLGFEAKLWAAADALRNNMDAAEYKHVVLGLIFLKYISDAFEAKHADKQRLGQLIDPCCGSGQMFLQSEKSVEHQFCLESAFV
jgi:type I restriction-modification system DNA methylase subunit